MVEMEILLRQARLVREWLERLAPDLVWGRLASGSRRASLYFIQPGCVPVTPEEIHRLQKALAGAYFVLEKVALGQR
jgi:hypothetical protein